MTVDAYLVDGWERGVIAPDELADALADGDEVIAALECVRSWDHGMRTAEELSADIVAEGAAWVMGPLLALMLPATDALTLWSVRDFASFAHGEAWVYCVAEYGLHRDGYSGLWHASDENGGERAGWLHEHADEMLAALEDAGYVTDQSGDAGMTWVYREFPMEPHEWAERGVTR